MMNRNTSTCLLFKSHLKILLCVFICVYMFAHMHTTAYIWMSEYNFVELVLLSLCEFQAINFSSQTWQQALLPKEPYSGLEICLVKLINNFI